MFKKKKEASAQEKLNKIIREKSEKNKILKKLLKEINKETSKNGHQNQNNK